MPKTFGRRKRNVKLKNINGSKHERFINIDYNKPVIRNKISIFCIGLHISKHCDESNLVGIFS